MAKFDATTQCNCVGGCPNILTGGCLLLCQCLAGGQTTTTKPTGSGSVQAEADCGCNQSTAGDQPAVE